MVFFLDAVDEDVITNGTFVPRIAAGVRDGGSGTLLDKKAKIQTFCLQQEKWSLFFKRIGCLTLRFLGFKRSPTTAEQ